MDFYHVNFAGFMLFNGCLAYREYREDTIQPTKDAEEPQASIPDQTSAQYFQRIFLVVYALVFGADWLQVCQSFPAWNDAPFLMEARRLHDYSNERYHRDLIYTHYTKIKKAFQRRLSPLYSPLVSSLAQSQLYSSARWQIDMAAVQLA